MTLNEEIKESIKVVEWLRQELQHTSQFNTGVKAQWVIQLNDIIKILRAEDYVEDIPPVTNPDSRAAMSQVSSCLYSEINSGEFSGISLLGLPTRLPKPERKSISLEDLKNI